MDAGVNSLFVAPGKGTAAHIDVCDDTDSVPLDPTKAWGCLRSRVHKVVSSKPVESFITLVIVLNMIIVINETDNAARGVESPLWISRTNYAMLAIYCVEISCKFYVWRIRIFLDGWSVLDFSVVTLDLGCLLLESAIGNMPNLSLLRIFRLVKLARTIRALNMFPELRILLQGFVAAFKAIFWGLILICVIVTIWSILAVQIVHPVNVDVTASGFYDRTGCERCPHAFESVWMSFLTIFQTVVAGDSWGTVAIPVAQQEPYTFFFFICVSVSVALAIMNLILAVICDAAATVRQNDEKNDILNQNAKTCEALDVASNHFLCVCESLDLDRSGSLSKEELVKGFDDNKEFMEIMADMGIKREHIGLVCHAFDIDGSGDVSYTEFVNTIVQAKHQDVQQMLLLLKFSIAEMQNKMDHFVKETWVGSRRQARISTRSDGSDVSVLNPPDRMPARISGGQKGSKGTHDDPLLRNLRVMAKNIENEVRTAIANTNCYPSEMVDDGHLAKKEWADWLRGSADCE